MAAPGSGEAQQDVARMLRRRAAMFYYKSLNGIHHDWISTGLDERGEIDPDVESLYVLLTDTWDTARSLPSSRAAQGEKP